MNQEIFAISSEGVFLKHALIADVFPVGVVSSVSPSFLSSYESEPVALRFASGRAITSIVESKFESNFSLFEDQILRDLGPTVMSIGPGRYSVFNSVGTLATPHGFEIASSLGTQDASAFMVACNLASSGRPVILVLEEADKIVSLLAWSSVRSEFRSLLTVNPAVLNEMTNKL